MAVPDQRLAEYKRVILMLQGERDAALGRAEAAEARVAELEQREARRHHLVTVMAPQNLAERQQGAEHSAALEAALTDLLMGAEQQSQSHVDVAERCRAALGLEEAP